MTGHRPLEGWLAQPRSPASPRLSGFLLSAARSFLKFLCLAPSRASVGLRPSRRIAAPEKRSRDLSPTGYCPPTAELHLETLPLPGRSDPRAVSSLHQPALCLSNSCFAPSTAEAGSSPVDKSTLRASGPEVRRSKERSGQRVNPVGRLEFSVFVPRARLLWWWPVTALAVRARTVGLTTV